MRVVVIMAGGSGERFWPLSRRERPKQLLALTSEQPMLSDTVDRVAGLVGKERIYIVAGAALTPKLRALLTDVPEENFLVEPEAKNTAPCLAFAAGVIAARLGEETAMGVMTADHLIRDLEAFNRNSELAFEQAETEDALITFGIPPTEPDTGFGYLEIGPALNSGDARGSVHQVLAFREKPDERTARKYFESGDFLWNSGMFFWKISTLMSDFERFAPELAAGAREIGRAAGGEDYEETVARVFKGWPKDSIDYAVMEKADNVRVVAADFDWDDVGTWTALARTLPLDDAGNLSRGKHLAIDTEGSIVFNKTENGSEPLIVTLGIKDMVVVAADDCILVCPRDRVQDIKKIHAALREKGEEDYL